MTVYFICRTLNALTRESSLNNDLNSTIKIDLPTQFLFHLKYYLDLFQMNLGLHLAEYLVRGTSTEIYEHIQNLIYLIFWNTMRMVS